MDDGDRARNWADQHDADALAAHFRRVRRIDPEAFRPADCEDCGEPIPERRLAAAPGCIRCIACQREFESRRII